VTLTALAPPPLHTATDERPLGATYLDFTDHNDRNDRNRCRFLVWVPHRERVELVLHDRDRDRKRVIEMQRGADGYWETTQDDVPPGTRYAYRLDGGPERPDPASRFQPDGPHGPSATVDPAFAWTDMHWNGPELRDYVLYEIHVGTFSPEGTFEGIIPYLGELAELGVTAIELMPVSQFPGGRNWGYDGTFPYSVQNTYGGPEGLRRFVDAAHNSGLAVVMDVVYNHLGPEGNYFSEFAPQYFTSKYKTLWGSALNYDDAHSDEVRRYFVENALLWPREYHIDALRLDATHAILDFSAVPFLSELAMAADDHAAASGRRFWLIAESDANDARYLRPVAQHGLGMHAQWSDDFHHALHVLLTGQRDGYYADFGTASDLAATLRHSYLYNGRYAGHRHRRHGNPSDGTRPEQFVVCIQNHDQIGNQMRGERLSTTLPLASLKVAAAATILSPFVPLLFMGEEYGEQAPFPYFISHTDAELVDLVRAGRKEEFGGFAFEGEIPDPASEAVYASARLDRALRHEGWHKTLWDWYRTLLALRRELPPLGALPMDDLTVAADDDARTLTMHRHGNGGRLFAAFNFGGETAAVSLPEGEGDWTPTLNSEAPEWGGHGAERHAGDRAVILPPRSVAVWK